MQDSPSAGSFAFPADAFPGEAADLLRGHDWAASGLPPVDGWPAPLVTVMRLVLGANQPMFVTWGPDRILLYNDAYAAILAAKHPGAFGRPFLGVWEEIAADLRPIVDEAYAGRPVYMDDITLVMQRRGYSEEAHFSFSYTPLHGERGAVEGMLCACVETTAQVLEERRRAFLYDLERRLRDLAGPEEIVAVSQRALGEHLGVNRVGYGEVGADERYFTTDANWTDGSVPPREGTHDLAGFGPEIWGSLRRGEALAVDDVSSDPRTNSPEARAAFEAIDTVAALTASLVKNGRMRAALYVHSRVPRRWSKSEIDLMDAVAERTWSAVERARAERQLRRERDRMSDVLQNMGDGFILLDREFRVLQINAEGMRLETRPVEEIIGRSHWEVWPGTEESELGALYKKAMADRRPATLEHSYIWPDGHETWLDMRAYPASDGLAIFYRDITARKASEARNAFMLELTDCLRSGSTEEALDAASALMGRYFGCTRVGYATLNAALDFFDFRTCWAEGVPPLLGQHPAHAFGRKIVAKLELGETVVVQDLFDDPLSDESVALQTANEVDTRSILVVPFVRGGRLKTIVYLNDQKPRRWSKSDVALVEEVAERTRQIIDRQDAEQALHNLNATLEAQVAERTADRDRMWRLTTDLMLVARFDSVITAINPAWTALLGWSEAELIGSRFLDYVHPDDLEATIAEASCLADGLTTLRFENRYRKRDGTYSWLSWTAVPGDGLIHAVARDMSAEKAAADELAQVQEALRQSQKLEAMGQLTGGVAHDFNNLLTPIIGTLDMLQRRGIGDERAQRLIGGGLQSAERAKTLVQRLLAFARRQPLQPVPIDLSQLVEGMAELVDSTSGPRVRVEVDVAPDLPPALADRNQLEMAILNLSVNSRDAMPDGGRLTIGAIGERVRAKHRTGLAPGHYLRLSVSDTGTGMDELTLARAVEPFFSTKGVGKGTGLGLSMAHGLAAQLGGALTIDSKLGVGTRVELWLPAAETSAEPAEPLSGLPLRRASGTALLIDDEDLVRASTADMLAELGYRVAEASSAEEALKLIDGGLSPDIVVTDHLMPGMTGTELAQILFGRNSGIPVLIVSGYAEDEGIAPDLPRLTKPFRQAELAVAVAALRQS
ncbi:MAG TPA: PAS domain-containing protein [Allosphingosinicella sp.]|jgi:PAS domain S-box-containing protein